MKMTVTLPRNIFYYLDANIPYFIDIADAKPTWIERFRPDSPVNIQEFRIKLQTREDYQIFMEYLSNPSIGKDFVTYDLDFPLLLEQKNFLISKGILEASDSLQETKNV